jgi:hypothetical protein
MEIGTSETEGCSMTQITLDQATAERLRQADVTIRLVDASGNFIGHFVPSTPPPPESEISDEEIQRRIQKGGGRPLKDILADLEKRS